MRLVLVSALSHVIVVVVVILIAVFEAMMMKVMITFPVRRGRYTRVG